MIWSRYEIAEVSRVCVTQGSLTDSAVQINSFYGQTQFQDRFGVYDAVLNQKIITASWQSGLSNSSVVGQLCGLVINAYVQGTLWCLLDLPFPRKLEL